MAEKEKKQIRKLKPHEIDIRVGTVSRNKPSAMLLLYKDARCDMSILDEVYGADKWQSQYEKIDGVLYCKIGVYNDEIKDWVWKQSNGIESQGTGKDDPNNAKGEASDSFKRAGFMWGIGRELYEWKGIWVNYDKVNDKYTDYKVTEISYDNNGKPKSITITGDDKVVYQIKNGKRVYKPNQEIKTADEANNDEPIEQDLEEDIMNNVKKNNRDIWNNLTFEIVKQLSKIQDYKDYSTKDLNGVASDYIKGFLKQEFKTPIAKMEFSTKQQAPSLKGLEVITFDNKLMTKLEDYVIANESGGN